MKLTPASQIPIRPMNPSPHQLLPAIPEAQRVLADGRATHSVLAGMINEWRRIGGGNALLRGKGRWSWYSDDSHTLWGRRSAPQSAVLCAIADHAAARVLVSGYREGITGNYGRVSYFSATGLRFDGPSIALAALDHELTGSTVFADWYLTTWCPSLHFHRHHSDELSPFCGSGTCATAEPETTCDCICGGVNHGLGARAIKVGPAPAPQWETAPAPRWYPEKGSVEAPAGADDADDFADDGTHRRVADRTEPHPRYLIEGQWRPETEQP